MECAAGGAVAVGAAGVVRGRVVAWGLVVARCAVAVVRSCFVAVARGGAVARLAVAGTAVGLLPQTCGDVVGTWFDATGVDARLQADTNSPSSRSSRNWKPR